MPKHSFLTSDLAPTSSHSSLKHHRIPNQERKTWHLDWECQFSHIMAPPMGPGKEEIGTIGYYCRIPVPGTQDHRLPLAGLLAWNLPTVSGTPRPDYEYSGSTWGHPKPLLSLWGSLAHRWKRWLCSIPHSLICGLWGRMRRCRQPQRDGFRTAQNMSLSSLCISESLRTWRGKAGRGREGCEKEVWGGAERGYQRCTYISETSGAQKARRWGRCHPVPEWTVAPCIWLYHFPHVGPRYPCPLQPQALTFGCPSRRVCGTRGRTSSRALRCWTGSSTGLFNQTRYGAPSQCGCPSMQWEVMTSIISELPGQPWIRAGSRQPRGWCLLIPCFLWRGNLVMSTTDLGKLSWQFLTDSKTVI